MSAYRHAILALEAESEALRDAWRHVRGDRDPALTDADRLAMQRQLYTERLQVIAALGVLRERSHRLAEEESVGPLSREEIEAADRIGRPELELLL